MSTYNDYIEYLKHVDNTTKEEIDKQIDSLNKEINALKASLTSLQKDKDMLSAQFAKSQKDLAAKDDMLNMKSVEINQHLRKQTELNNSIDFIKKQKEELNVLLGQEKERLKTKVAEIEEKDQQLARQKKELDDKVIKLQADYNELLAKLTSSDSSAAAFKRNMETLQRQLDQKAENIQQLQAQIVNLNKQNEILNQKIKQNNDNSSELQKELQIELNAANDKIRRLNIEKKELNSKIGDGQQLLMQIDNLNSQNEVLKQKIRLNSNNSSELQKDLDEANDKIRTLNKEKDSLYQEIEHIKANDTLDAKFAKKLEEATAKLTQLQNKNERLQKTLEKKESQVANLDSTNTSLRLALDKNKKTHKLRFWIGLVCGVAILSIIWFLSPSPQDTIPQDLYGYVVNEESSIDTTITGTYTGQTKENIHHGIGQVTFADSVENNFKGAFKDGNFYYGVRTLGNGNVYTGPYVNGQANGVGSYHFSDGSRYIGEFKDDAMNGYGIYIDEKGNKSMGEFKNNEFIK